MKNFKRFLAAILAMTVLFATSVFAQEPREILSQATANSADVTVFSMNGHIVMNISVDELLMRLDVDFDMNFDVDIEAGAMKMYMRMPMNISMQDRATGEVFDESISIAMFMDEDGALIYVEGIGWFADPSMDVVGDMGMFMGDFDEIMQWALELDEAMMDMIELEFAAVQPEGYYVVEMVMDFDDLMDMMDMMLTSEFFGGILAFMPEADMAELDSMMGEIAALFDEMDIELEMTSRTYIDVETVNIQRSVTDMSIAITGDLDFGILGSVAISGDVTMMFEINYDSEIVWPVIDEIISLEDLLADLGLETFELAFGEHNQEERVALTLSGSTMTFIEIEIDSDANFNVFLVNHGDNDVLASLMSVFDVIILPGDGFVMQVPAEMLDAAMTLFVHSEAGLNVEAGFRLTNLPLGMEQ